MVTSGVGKYVFLTFVKSKKYKHMKPVKDDADPKGDGPLFDGDVVQKAQQDVDGVSGKMSPLLTLGQCTARFRKASCMLFLNQGTHHMDMRTAAALARASYHRSSTDESSVSSSSSSSDPLIMACNASTLAGVG